MCRRIILLFLFSILMLSTRQLQAQNISVQAFLDSSKIRIGEQTKIELVINYKNDQKNTVIQWPKLSDTLRKEVEIVNVSAIDTTIPDKNEPQNLQQKQIITITSFDSGYWAIQPFVFIVNHDTLHPYETQPLLLEVKTIPVDTAEASIKDVKAPFEEPFNWKEYLPQLYWALGITVAILIAVFIFLRFVKKQPEKALPPPPAEAPHVTALRSLEKIKEQKLWQEGKNKEYYTAVTDVLRVYIEGRYKVHAMELTTDEIMNVMKSQVIDQLSREKLQQVLALADYVKFAKARPIDVENELAWNNALEFVKGTMREESIV